MGIMGMSCPSAETAGLTRARAPGVQSSRAATRGPYGLLWARDEEASPSAGALEARVLADRKTAEAESGRGNRQNVPWFQVVTRDSEDGLASFGDGRMRIVEQVLRQA